MSPQVEDQTAYLTGVDQSWTAIVLRSGLPVAELIGISGLSLPFAKRQMPGSSFLGAFD